MKKIIFLSVFAFAGQYVVAQGLENVVLETYYISDMNDTSVNNVGGILPPGSVTYRIYADMLPGYKFQAAYGVPGHEMRIETSTLFFNNEDRGATTPTYTKNHTEDNTVMLDSWLSVGAACTNNFGIMKDLDDGVATVVNSDGVLQNNDPLAGIPLTSQDGLISGTPEAVTIVGISNEISVFDNQNDGTNGPLFSTSNGSWAALSGATGPDSTDNKVLIAQITTDGLFSYKLNIQIGTPSGGVENYVAENPVASEILMPSLTYPQPVGIKEEQDDLSFTIFPNPVTTSMLISTDKLILPGSDLNIYNITGAKVYSLRNLQRPVIDVSGMNQGLYVMELIHGQKVLRSKFIKN